jgi:hypothetical protein
MPVKPAMKSARWRRWSRNLNAEGEGFEPPKACTLVVFKTTAIDHSAIPPATLNDTVTAGNSLRFRGHDS